MFVIGFILGVITVIVGSTIYVAGQRSEQERSRRDAMARRLHDQDWPN